MQFFFLRSGRWLACALSVLAVAYPAGAWGQKSPDLYAGEPGVIERQRSIWTMNADGTGTHEIAYALRVQSDPALKDLGVLNVPYAANSEHVEFVYARARHKDGTVTQTDVKTAIEVLAPVTREAPFYSDLKALQLPVKTLGVGDTLEWEARVVRAKPEADGQFWGSEDFPTGAVVLSATLELRVPKDETVNVWSHSTKPAETVEGAKRVYRWSTSQLKPTVGKDADAEKEAKKKHVLTEDEETDVREGALPDVAWSTFKSWEEVGAWYRRLEGDRTKPDAEIEAKVAALTGGKTTGEDKVRAVYAYVATQLRYIGVAFGVGRYQPHTAGDVLQNQYGDCKDKHTLLAAMLRALGLQPEAVLIGVETRFNPSVPSPAAFNHVLTKVEVGGKPVWLDATAEVAPYGMLMAATRDKNALVVPETGPAAVERTPANPPFAQMQKLEADGSLTGDGVSTSRFTLTFRGDVEVALRAAFRQLNPSQYDDGTQQLVRDLGFGGTVTHAEITRPDDTAEPFKLSFDYKREKVGDWANYRTLAQLMPVDLARPDPKTPFTASLDLGVPRLEVSTAAMKLPAGWSAEIPEAQHVKCPYATYDATYRYDKGVLYAERRIEVLKARVPAADWKTYSKFAEDADLGSEPYIQLIRTVDAKPAASGGAAEDPGKLIDDAFSAVGRRQYDAAAALLDRAKEINPKQPFLWSTYAYLSQRRDEIDTAAADYKQEVTLHPNELGVYTFLADAQFRAGQVAAANATLRTWVSLDPGNPEAPAKLANFLLDEGKPDDAAAAADHALHALPGDADTGRLQLLLGRAYLAAGSKDKASATLIGLIESTGDPGMLNDAAYELANAGMELPLAESTTRRALEKLESETSGWTLDESYATLLAKTSLLEATWDTLGWVLFREGKLDDAQQYVQPAWRGRQHAEVGEHLGDIAAARGDKDGALADYELALTTVNPLGGDMAAGIANVSKDLNKRIAKLQAAGASSPLEDAADTLQKLRKFPLGASAGLTGSAWYKLLVTEGKVQRAEPVEARAIPGGSERLKGLRLDGFAPAGSHASLMLVGLLTCRPTGCELVLQP